MPAQNFTMSQEIANSPAVKSGCVAGLKQKIVTNVLSEPLGGAFGSNNRYKKVQKLAQDIMLFPELYTPAFALEILRTVDVNFFDDVNSYDQNTLAGNITNQMVENIAGVNASDN